jgi:hypothetical protein
MKITYLLAGFLALSLTFGACGTVRTPKKEFIVDVNSPKTEIGEVYTQIDRLLSIGGLRKINVTVSYYPQEDAVCLKYVADLMTYYQFWSAEGRAAFINALVQYNEDYAARNLVRSNLRTFKQYGTIQGYLVWQLHQYSLKAMANMNVELGYFFKDRAPYFTVNQRDAEYIKSPGSDDNRTSPTIPMYFTRAQAEDLAILFDPELLQAIVENRSGLSGSNFFSERDIPTDEY